jgi:hypothetical protein
MPQCIQVYLWCEFWQISGPCGSRRGIETNPDQIATLVDLAEPRNIKQVQRLTGMVAALRCFISRSADKCKPFFRLLGKKSKFVWDEECSVAFQGIKAYLSTPSCLSIPIRGNHCFCIWRCPIML